MLCHAVDVQTLFSSEAHFSQKIKRELGSLLQKKL